MEHSQELAKRHRDSYLSAVGSSRGGSTRASSASQPSTGQHTGIRRAKTSSGKLENYRGEDRITEEDLDDDEAVFKRHVARLADTRTMITTSPIRVQDVVKKSEVQVPVQ